MKSVMIAAAGFLTLALPAFAQVPTSNATVKGGATTSGNAAGAPAPSTPAGVIATTGSGVATPPATSALTTPGMAAAAPTADSKVTGTTDATPK